jgi:hypothetical protein
MSARYSTVVAMLDNDENFACVVRELMRRGELGTPRRLALPPKDGGNGSLCYMSFRWHLSHTLDTASEDAVRDDILVEVWADPGTTISTEWWLTLQDGAEVGPFPNKKEAVSEARRFLTREGWIFVGIQPWDAEDESIWAMVYR